MDGKSERDRYRPAPIRELRQSLFLLGLVVSSLGGYIGLGFVAVRLLARH